MKAYQLISIPENIRFRKEGDVSLNDFSIEEDDLKQAFDYISQSIEIEGYYFNQYVYCILTYLSGDMEKIETTGGKMPDRLRTP